MSAKFRVGLSPGLDPRQGRLKFPSYDVRALAGDDRFELDYFSAGQPLAAAELQDYDALVLLGERMAAESFPADGRLSLIARMGVGYDTVDVPACTQNQVLLTITPPAVARPMAVATLNLLLSLANKMMVKDRIARQGQEGWAQVFDHHGMGLVGRTLGMVGLGNIGLETLRLVAPLDMNVIGYDPALSDGEIRALGVEPANLDDVFARSDFVSVHCFLNEDTRHLVNAKRLALMQPTAYLINTSRGPVVDQQALYEALACGAIAGAGLDVLDPEPLPEDDPIAHLSNVILAPHALGWTDQMFASMAEINMAAIRAVAAGGLPENIVNSELGQSAALGEKLQRYKDAT